MKLTVQTIEEAIFTINLEDILLIIIWGDRSLMIRLDSE